MAIRFQFHHVSCFIQVLWASLPPKTKVSGDCADEGTLLFESKFGKKEARSISSASFSGGKRETTFANVVTLRKRLSSSEESPKRKLSLIAQQRGRIQSAGSAEEQTAATGGGPRASR